jgi:hypothetical protein
MASHDNMAPDVALVVVQARDLRALASCQQFRQQRPPVRIQMLSNHRPVDATDTLIDRRDRLNLCCIHRRSSVCRWSGAHSRRLWPIAWSPALRFLRSNQR